MDRSFLSRPEVIAASRSLVCVRLATYESRSEGDFLKAFRVTRSGELENTVFTILAPDGKQQLARASRSARQTFGDAAQMADAMNRIAAEYKVGARPDVGLPELPLVSNVRLAIDVAACDNRPLVLVFAPDPATRNRLEERLRPLAWSERFLGRFTYVSTAEAKDLGAIAGARAEPGVLVVQSDEFGQKGTVLRQMGPDGDLAKCLAEGAAVHAAKEKTFANHVREGQRHGAFWETVIPVTDPMERQARERGRRSGP